MSDLGVAIIGAGTRGSDHARAWQAEGVRIVNVCDIIEEKGKNLAEKYNANFVLDWEAAIADPEVNIVSVCVPANWHAPMTLAAINRHQRHVLCEKPATLSLADADAMIAAAQQANVRLGFSFQRRFGADVESFVRVAREGSIGRPIFFHVAQPARVRPKIEMHDVFGNAGPIVDVLCHTFDIWALMFESNPVTVKAAGTTLAQDDPSLASLKNLAPDTASVTVEYASGDIGSFTVSWGLPAGKTPPGFEVIMGPKGSIRVQGLKIESYIGGEEPETKQLAHPLPLDQAMMRDFLAAIREGREPKATGRDARNALAISIAALISLRTGKAVNVDEVGKSLPDTVAGALGLA